MYLKLLVAVVKVSIFYGKKIKNFRLHIHKELYNAA